MVTRRNFGHVGGVNHVSARTLYVLVKYYLVAGGFSIFFKLCPYIILENMSFVLKNDHLEIRQTNSVHFYKR